jgi:hypothetical protein
MIDMFIYAQGSAAQHSEWRLHCIRQTAETML